MWSCRRERVPWIASSGCDTAVGLVDHAWSNVHAGDGAVGEGLGEADEFQAGAAGWDDDGPRCWEMVLEKLLYRLLYPWLELWDQQPADV